MNQFQEIFDKQKAYFDSDATKSYEWRIDQLTRLENLCNENAEVLEAAMSCDFKTASQEKVFEIMAPVGTVAFAKQDLKEWMKPVDVVVPKALWESGHTAKAYREPYGVTLVIDGEGTFERRHSFIVLDQVLQLRSLLHLDNTIGTKRNAQAFAKSSGHQKNGRMLALLRRRHRHDQID